MALGVSVCHLFKASANNVAKWSGAIEPRQWGPYYSLLQNMPQRQNGFSTQNSQCGSKCSVEYKTCVCTDCPAERTNRSQNPKTRS
jgi:hypothetical protein